jgi:hypothetical protein
VGDDAGGRRLVVVRRDDEEPVHAECVRFACEVDGVRGGVRTRVGDNSPAVLARDLDRGLKEPELLLVRQGRRLAGRPGDDDAVRAVFEEVRADAPERVDVDRAVVREGRHDRREDAT